MARHSPTESSCKPYPPPLPPRDHGTAAYKALIGAVLVNGVAFAFPLSFGIFQNHYDEKFPGNNRASWIGVLGSGIPFLGAPFITWACQNLYVPRLYYVAVGWMFCGLSLLASAFCTSLTVLILLQGLFYGIGALLVEITVLLIIKDWFHKRRGMVFGLMYGLADLMGFATTFLAEFLLDARGYKLTVIIMSALVFVIPLPSLFLLRERATEQWVPVMACQELMDMTPTESETTQCDTIVFRKFHSRPMFYVLAIANLLQALAYYLPYIYLPSFATELGCSRLQRASILAFANLAQFVGETSFGKLSDKMAVTLLVVVCTFVPAILTLTLWGFTQTFAQLMVYAMLYGVFGSGVLALWARMSSLFGERDASTVYSIFCFGRGIGSIVSGPLSSTLLIHAPALNPLHEQWGSGRYVGVIFWVTATNSCAALLSLAGIFASRMKSRAPKSSQPSSILSRS